MSESEAVCMAEKLTAMGFDAVAVQVALGCFLILAAEGELDRIAALENGPEPF